MAGITTVNAVDATGATIHILAGSDGTNVAPGHTLIDVNGSPTGTSSNPLSGALTAGESHVGEVGGNIAKFQAQFGPSSSTTYTAGQCLSGVIEVTGMGRVANGSGLITAPALVLNTLNTQQVDLIFFASQPSGTYTAGSTFTLNTTDLAKVSKVFHLSDWTALGAAVSIGEPSPAPKFFRCDDGTKTTSLWVVAVTRGSITLVTATDATLTIRASRN